MSDPFGREPPERHRHTVRVALIPIRLVAPVAVAWLVARLASLPVDLALIPGALVAALLVRLDNALRDGDPRPGPNAEAPAPALKRALVVASGVAYGGLVLAVLLLTGEPAFPPALVAFALASEEMRERLGLPPPEEKPPRGPTFAESLPGEFRERGRDPGGDPRDRFFRPH